jgi:hypothetical protein
LEQQQRHTGWLKIITIMRYASLVFPIIQSSKADRTKHRKISTAAIKIQTKMINWYERKVLMRYANFVSQIYDVVWRFRLYVAIFQKRRAARILRTYLQEKRENREFAQLVHAFLAGVRKIQCLARNFIACKMSRIRALASLWEDLETQYIQVPLPPPPPSPPPPRPSLQADCLGFSETRNEQPELQIDEASRDR